MLLDKAMKITEAKANQLRRSEARVRILRARREAERQEMDREFEEMCHAGENGLGPWDLDDEA
jgi:hypothetical protein